MFLIDLYCFIKCKIKITNFSLFSWQFLRGPLVYPFLQTTPIQSYLCRQYICSQNKTGPVNGGSYVLNLLKGIFLLKVLGVKLDNFTSGEI